ncbi:MAG TPA: malonyl CoA-acyl carrier protein transacylase, partial [Vicinamibacteria bacterium]|nr:malonyl CoA-acyl carrier protein transacylase [Vicinamibacteria bacterium]
RDGQACRDGLVRQVSGAVRWQESVELLAREGVDVFVEVGPGTVLSGLVRRTARGARVLGVDSPESLETAVAALGAGAEG